MTPNTAPRMVVVTSRDAFILHLHNKISAIILQDMLTVYTFITYILLY
jgi:hypothetical protein